MKIKPESRHVAFRDELVAVLKKHGDNLTAPEMLALAAHMVGQLVALQDQRSMSPGQAMEIVAANIEEGNQEVIGGLLNSRGSS